MRGRTMVSGRRRKDTLTMHRIGIRGTLAAAALLAVCLLTGCNTPGAGSGGGAVAPGGSTAPSTKGTVQKIQDQLTKDPAMKGAKVTVSATTDGTVQLEGSAVSVAQKDAAEKIVHDVQTADKLQPAVVNNLLVQDAASAPEGGTKGDNH